MENFLDPPVHYLTFTVGAPVSAFTHSVGILATVLSSVAPVTATCTMGVSLTVSRRILGATKFPPLAALAYDVIGALVTFLSVYVLFTRGNA
jgi:hypothetical protein